MKTIPVESLSSRVRDLITAAPKGRVLLTRHGKPFAIVTDASNLDAEDIGYITDPEFWKSINESRRQTGRIPLEDVERRIRAEEKKLNGRRKSKGKKQKV